MHINDVYAIRQILKDLHFTPMKDVARVNAAIEACDEEIESFEAMIVEMAAAEEEKANAEMDYYYGA
jgi:coenzyme F420-reducing hydrogenase gamma subunit